MLSDRISHACTQIFGRCRCKNLQIGYTLPKQGFFKDHNLRVYLSAQNLFTITNYKGLDPEVCSAGSGTGGSGSVGIDYLGVPSTSSLSFGVNITF